MDISEKKVYNNYVKKKYFHYFLGKYRLKIILQKLTLVRMTTMKRTKTPSQGTENVNSYKLFKKI